jgi:hypothetical protein
MDSPKTSEKKFTCRRAIRYLLKKVIYFKFIVGEMGDGGKREWGKVALSFANNKQKCYNNYMYYFVIFDIKNGGVSP